MPGLTLRLPAPERFSFATTVRSHGWYDLPPFEYDATRSRLVTAIALDERRAVQLVLTAGARGGIRASASGADLKRNDRGAVERTARRILALDVDLESLYRLLAADPERAWTATAGAGRFLRAPTLWEDVVKLILTTNCSWALTSQMVRRLVDALGLPVGDGARAFPTPAAMAAQPEPFYRTVVRAGYRSPSLVRLSRLVAGGEVDLEALVGPSLSSDEARRALVRLPGVGPYVAENLLRLLGRHDFLGLDSWSRATYARILRDRGRRSARPPSDRAITRAYARFGRDAGLVFWLDVTRHWHVERAADERPF